MGRISGCWTGAALAQQPEPNRLCRPGPGIWLGSFRGTKLAIVLVRIDPLLPEMLGVKRLGSQSELLPLLWAV